MSPIIKIQHSFGARRSTTRAGIAVAVLCAIFYSASLRAEEESRSADVAAARELAIEGLKLADAGQCAQAIDKLSRAEKLHHAPIVLGRLGECLIAEGKIVDGTEDLRRLLREPPPNNPPPALVKARERAQVALDAAKPKIAFLTISVREPADGVTVTVDGQLVPPAVFDRGRPTDPGEHFVEATAPGFLKSSRQVTLGPGERQDLAFNLVVDPEAPAAARDAQASELAPTLSSQAANRASNLSAPTNAQVATSEPEASPNYAASYVLWSIGTATAAVGGVFGYLALKDKGELDKQCSNNLCPPTAQAQLDSANREAMVSTVLLGSGGAVLAVGTVVYFLSGSSAEKPPLTASSTVQPVLGLGRVGLQGTF